MERESAISKHRFITQPFLKDAFKEGAHRITPENLSENRWFRQVMIGVAYNDIGSSATFQELADKNGMSHQGIAQINDAFLISLHNNCSAQIQGRYPLNTVLAVRKPWSQRSKEKMSASKGGVSLRIKEQVESGVTDRGKISENTGISKPSIRSAANSVLKDWGVNVPRKISSYKETLKQLEKETDDKKIQELLDGLPYFTIMRNIAKKREASKFSSLHSLIREAGFRSRDNHAFAASLESAGVPISRKDHFLKDGRSQTYYMVLSRHKDRIIQVLRGDQSLQRFQRESSK